MRDLNYYNITIEEINELYNGINWGCGKSNYVYNYNTNKVYNSLCHNFKCQRCRKILKRKLFLDLIDICKQKNLTHHYIITTSGDEYRSNNNITQSYYDMAYNWKKIKNLVNYWYGDKWDNPLNYSYVVMPRSQQDGYCHYHLLTDLNINIYWLDTKRRKYDSMGYVKLGKNRNPVYYLTYDFWKDNEYYIPPGFRHFSTSRDIQLTYRNPIDKENTINYHYNTYLSSYRNLEAFNNLLLEKYNTCLPFETFLTYFVTGKI